MKKSIRRLVSCLLTMTLACSLAISASALSPVPDEPPMPPRPTITTAPSDNSGAVTDLPQDNISDGPVSGDLKHVSDETSPTPETIDGASIMTSGGILETTVPDPYLYWVAGVLDDTPEIRLDPNTGEKYLAFQLANISKLEYFYNTHGEAFRLESNLRYAEELTKGQSVIWEKGGWSASIGEQLSEAAQLHIKTTPMNGLEAMAYVKTLPEYQTNEQLRQQIDYRLACFTANLEEIAEGMEMLRTETNANTIPLKSISAEYVRQVRAFLGEHPELQCLDEVVQTAHSMPTSKFLTLQSLGQERVDELYAKIEAVAKVYWPNGLTILDRYSFVIPMNGNLSWLK